MPAVSVVIPCFNLGEFVVEAIDSVQAQTFQDFEIIVVDDGSTDPATQQTLDRLDQAKTRLLRSENRGLSAARNLGIRHAAGRYISALDADDLLAPTWLERGAAVLDADPGLAFVSHWLETFGDEQWTWTPDRADLAVLLDRNAINGAALFRRELVEAIGGFDESMRDGCEDWEFWLRAVEAGHRGAIIPEVLYRYRRRPGSMSRHMKEADLEAGLLGDIIGKHTHAYTERLTDLVLRREWNLAEMWLATDGARLELRTSIEPALEERELELAAVTARLEHMREAERIRTETERLRAREQEHAHLADTARRTLDAMRSSWSWRVTAPFRRLYERAGLGPRASHDQ